MRKYLALAVLIQCIQYSCLHAQNFTYKLLNTSDGLPSAEIIALEQDYKGYLWIGTNIGLSKYDGYHFENFQYSSDNQLIGKVNSIKEDQQHRLWIGTEAGLFQQVNNHMYKVSDKHELMQGVNMIWLEKDGLWLGTESGPAYLNPEAIALISKTGSVNLKNYILSSWKNAQPESMRVTKICRSDEGVYYFASNTALYQYDGKQLNLIFQYHDRNDMIWQLIPGAGNKLYFFTAQHTWHTIEDGHHNNLPFENIYKPDSDPKEKPVWVLGPNSFYLFYPNAGVIKTKYSFEKEGVMWTSAIIADHQENIWVATHNGLLKFQPGFFQQYPHEEYGLPEEIYSIKETSDGKLLV